MKRRVVRTYPIRTPLDGTNRIRVPVLSYKASVAKVWGKKEGFAEIIDEAAAFLADLDDAPFEIEIALIERGTRPFDQVPIPEDAERCVGSYFDEYVGRGFFAFIVRKGARSYASKRGR